MSGGCRKGGTLIMKIRRMNNNVLEICDEDSNVILAIAEELVDGKLKITLSGEIKNEVAHEFEDEVMAALSVCPNLIIDFSKVTYIASFALKSLLSVQQMIDEIDNSSMVLIHVSKEVMSIFKESGFSEILMIENE